MVVTMLVQKWVWLKQGRIQGWGGRTRRAPPLKLEKNMIFWRKIVIFHTKYPNNFRASLRNWKKIWFFGVKSWFFTRNTQQISRLPPLGAIFLSAPPPNLKSWIRPCKGYLSRNQIEFCESETVNVSDVPDS
jgi:hypothetical protein